jgi:hypothetical protein
MSLTRVHYRERQRLVAADLRAEQAYRMALAARHHLASHDWGVVRGLRIARSDAGAFTLLPGVAIDGNGRELVVAEPVPLDVEDTERCWWIVLHACERPEQVPPGRACQDRPAPRLAPRVLVSVDDAFADPVEDEDPMAGIGVAAGGRPWPVLVARIGRACAGSASAPIVDYSLTRYVRHRAAVVRSPHGRAQLQLGLLDRTDIYQFLLSTRGQAGALERRAGIDRDGDVHVWRPLVFSGTMASGAIALAANRLLTFEAALPGGIGRRLRIDGALDPGRGSLTAQLFDLGGAAASPGAVLSGRETFAVDEPLSARFDFGAGHFADISLLDPAVGELVPILDPRIEPRASRRRRTAKASRAAQPAQAAATAVRSFSVELQPGGAALALREHAADADAVGIGCDDVSRVRETVRQLGTPVVQFRPAMEIDADPETREIHAAITSPPAALVPHVTLRVSGGAEDDSDKSSRISFGGRRDDDWVPAIEIDGSRGVAILASNGGTSDEVLQVAGTVYLPPIGKKDPLLTELMAFAFMTGLRQRATVPTVSVAVTLGELTPPATIVRGQTLDYELAFTFSGSVTVQRVVELVIGTSGTGDMMLRTLPGIAPTSTTKEFDVEIPNFTHGASMVTLQVHVLLKRGSQTGVIVSEPIAIAVVDPQ